MPPEQAEEAKSRFNETIENRVRRVLQGVEVTEEKLIPMQEALIRFFAPMQIEQAKMQAERQKMQALGGCPTTRDRQAMMQRRQKLEKLRGDLDKKVKVILDKKQYKTFQSKMAKCTSTAACSGRPKRSLGLWHSGFLFALGARHGH